MEKAEKHRRKWRCQGSEKRVAQVWNHPRTAWLCWGGVGEMWGEVRLGECWGVDLGGSFRKGGCFRAAHTISLGGLWGVLLGVRWRG